MSKGPVRCEHCGAEAEPPQTAPYPEGWGRVRIMAVYAAPGEGARLSLVEEPFRVLCAEHLAEVRRAMGVEG